MDFVMLLALLVLVNGVVKAEAAQMQFEVLPGYKIAEMEGLLKNLTETSAVQMEVLCVKECADPLCSAVSYNKETKTCRVNSYARVLLEADPQSTTWISSTLLFLSLNWSKKF